MTRRMRLQNSHQRMDGRIPIGYIFSYGILRSFRSEKKNSDNLAEDDPNGHIVKLKTRTMEAIFAIFDSGRPMSFLHKKGSFTAKNWQINDIQIDITGRPR